MITLYDVMNKRNDIPYCRVYRVIYNDKEYGMRYENKKLIEVYFFNGYYAENDNSDANFFSSIRTDFSVVHYYKRTFDGWFYRYDTAGNFNRKYRISGDQMETSTCTYFEGPLVKDEYFPGEERMTEDLRVFLTDLQNTSYRHLVNCDRLPLYGAEQ